MDSGLAAELVIGPDPLASIRNDAKKITHSLGALALWLRLAINFANHRHPFFDLNEGLIVGARFALRIRFERCIVNVRHGAYSTERRIVTREVDEFVCAF